MKANFNIQKKTSAYAPLMLMSLVVLYPEMALAQGANPIEQFFDSLLEFFNGGFARTLAIIAIIVAGIGALIGKIAWPTVGKVAVGIVLIFGAAKLVDLFISWSA